MDSLINEIVLRERSQWEAAKDKVSPTAKIRGFGTQQYNPRTLRRRASAFMGERLVKSVQENFNSEQRKTALLAHIGSKMTAADRIVLFRYIDFDVEQSNRYRYQVKFQLGNPNFGRDPSEVAYPEVALGPTRWTEFSKPTEPVLVPPDFNYFLTGVEDARVGGRRQPRAMLNMFYWYPDSGTVVNEVLSTQIGQMIGGATQAEVLDPVNSYFERQDIDMETESALVDVSDNPKINKRLHPDLELPTLQRGRLGISPRALTVDQSGKLRSLDSVSQADKLRQVEQRLEWERRDYNHLKNAIANAEAASEADYLMPGDDDDDDDDDGYRRKKSAIRKKGRRRGRRGDD